MSILGASGLRRPSLLLSSFPYENVLGGLTVDAFFLRCIRAGLSFFKVHALDLSLLFFFNGCLNPAVSSVPSFFSVSCRWLISFSFSCSFAEPFLSLDGAFSLSLAPLSRFRRRAGWRFTVSQRSKFGSNFYKLSSPFLSFSLSLVLVGLLLARCFKVFEESAQLYCPSGYGFVLWSVIPDFPAPKSIVRPLPQIMVGLWISC